MTKVRAKMNFNFSKFNEITNLERAKEVYNDEGVIYLKDTFNCNDELADYLTKGNDFSKKTGLPLVEIIEVIPDEKKEEEKTATKKKRTKK